MIATGTWHTGIALQLFLQELFYQCIPIREARRLKTDLSIVDMQNDLWFLAIVNEDSMINKRKGFGQILERARITVPYDLFWNGVATCLNTGSHSRYMKFDVRQSYIVQSNLKTMILREGVK